MWLHSYRSYQVINYNNYLIAPSIGLTGFERSLSNIDNASFVRKLPHKLTKKNNFYVVNTIMANDENIKYAWLIMVLNKKFENQPYELSCNELNLLKLHEQSCSACTTLQ